MLNFKREPQNNKPLLRLENVAKRFQLQHETDQSFQDIFIKIFRRLFRRNSQMSRGKTFWALNDVSFDVYPGESVGILGPNGSGKSTLLKLITGILEPTSGRITLNGRISALLELGAGFHPDLTGRENIFLNGSLYGLRRKEIQGLVDSIIEFAELGDFIDMPIKHYSSGMYVRLGFAIAIHTEPDLLIVDEVLAVGDANFQHKCMDAIQSYRKRGGSLLLVSHDLGSIESICDRAIWYEKGEIQSMGQPTDVVMKYLNHVARKEEAAANAGIDIEQDSADRLDATQRWGTRRIEIVDVKLCDKDGTERTIFLTGAPMQIRLKFRSKERIEDPIFGIAIYHQNGTWVTGPNTGFSNLTIAAVEGEGEVVFEAPEIPLLAGGYQVSVAAVDREDTEMYDYHDRAYPFRVHTGNTRERYGIVTLNGSWRLPENPKTITTEKIVAQKVPTGSQ